MKLLNLGFLKNQKPQIQCMRKCGQTQIQKMQGRKFRDLESGYMGSAAQIEMKMKLAVSGATALLLYTIQNFTNKNEIQQGLRNYSARRSLRSLRPSNFVFVRVVAFGSDSPEFWE